MFQTKIPICSRHGAVSVGAVGFGQLKALVLNDVLNKNHGRQDDTGRHQWRLQAWQMTHQCADGKWLALSVPTVAALERLLSSVLSRGELLRARALVRPSIPDPVVPAPQKTSHAWTWLRD